MSRLSRPGARAGVNARDLSSGLVAGGQHDENRGAQLATAGSRMDATKDSTWQGSSSSLRSRVHGGSAPMCGG
ncbi:hypothetical protein G6F22_019614 [Rhizopus arrhizus]|nr:hypothetical protein G6F22_019614 [Rhizopus arrhizus]